MARKRYNFWLDEKNPGDWALNDLIAKLKNPERGQGQFTRAIREGLRLWDSLQKRDVSILLELFPWVADAIRKTQSAPDDSDLRNEIRQLQMLILQQGSINAPPKDYPVMKPVVPTIVVNQAAPISADAIADNFLSMFS